MIEISGLAFGAGTAAIVLSSIIQPWLAVISLPMLLALLVGLVTERVRVEHGNLAESAFVLFHEEE